MAILECKNIKKTYKTKNIITEALKGVNFSVEKGEFISIMGESGAGKTTLLNIIATLDRATSGVLSLNGKDISTLKSGEIARFRRKELGFVFQDFNLLDQFSNRDNIYLPLVLSEENLSLMEADEPTGALDSTSSEMILNLFRQVNEDGQTVLVVTHSLRAASYAKRVLFIKDGIVFHEIYRGENEAQGDFMERISQAEFMLGRGKKL